jgi:hypothetical protein
MIISYVIGQKHFPINYQLKTIGKYSLLALVLFFLGWAIDLHYTVLNLLYRTALLAIYVWYMTRRDFPLSQVPYINKFFKK